MNNLNSLVSVGGNYSRFYPGRSSFRSHILDCESKLGGAMFDKPDSLERRFFCLDKNIWVFYEAWPAVSGQERRVTYYFIKPNGIFKSLGHGPCVSVSAEETKWLLKAARHYRDKVKKQLYKPLLSRLNQ